MVPVVTLARCAGAVGLDLVARLYPGTQPIRDAAQVALLAGFRARLHRSLRWATEVPIPIPGDQRAWDATVGSGSGDQPAFTGARRRLTPAPGPAGSADAAPAEASALSTRPAWCYGVEAETLPRDAQAIHRRNQLKLRDGRLDGVLLVLPDTRRARDFVRQALPELRDAYPVPGERALGLLRAGVDPGGSSIILVAGA